MMFLLKTKNLKLHTFLSSPLQLLPFIKKENKQNNPRWPLEEKELKQSLLKGDFFPS